MGEAFTAVADDVNALYWNPAGLTSLERPHFGATHQQAYQGLDHEFFGYAQPLPSRRGVWGTSLSILSVPGDLERRAEEGAGALGTLTTPQGTFGATDMAFGGSFAFQHRRHSYGISAKLIRQAIDNRTAHSGAVDLGWIRREALPNLSLGAAVLNLGPGVRFTRNWYPLPLTFKAGAAYRMERIRTRLAMDLLIPRDDFPFLSFGGEVALWQFLYLRAGYRNRWGGNPNGDLAGFRTGMGFLYKNLTLDYAAAPFGDLGISHRFSLGWRFDPVRRESREAPPAPAAAAPSAPKPAPAALPLPAPSAPAMVSEGMTAFAVQAKLKTLSARGSDFQITASAPSEDWLLRRVEYRAAIPSGGGVQVAAAEARAHKPLPSGWKAVKVYSLQAGASSVARSVFLSFRASEGAAVLGLFSGEWRELASETQSEILRASSDRFPEAVALVQ